ncbi:hypothetical protein D9M71_833180 [compost metagenome]
MIRPVSTSNGRVLATAQMLRHTECSASGALRLWCRLKSKWSISVRLGCQSHSASSASASR